MNITLWFRKIYESILSLFSGGQPVTTPETSTTNQEPPVSASVKEDLDSSAMKSYFLDLSAALTGFSQFELQGTGQADLYYSTVEQEIDRQVLQELLQTFNDLDPSNLDEVLSSEILESEKLGAIARNIVKLWYVATWYPLSEKEEAFIVSPQAYPEGLLWPSIGVNPPAAKAPGYATWSEEPTVTLN